MNLSISIVGLNDLLKATDGARFGKRLERAINRSGQALRDDTKKLPAVSAKRNGYDARGIPVDSGRMRQSIESRPLAALAAEVFAPVNYSGYVHFGTARMQARPFFLWALEAGTEKKISTIFEEELSIALDGK